MSRERSGMTWGGQERTQGRCFMAVTMVAYRGQKGSAPPLRSVPHPPPHVSLHPFSPDVCRRVKVSSKGSPLWPPCCRWKKWRTRESTDTFALSPPSPTFWCPPPAWSRCEHVWGVNTCAVRLSQAKLCSTRQLAVGFLPKPYT